MTICTYKHLPDLRGVCVGSRTVGLHLEATNEAVVAGIGGDPGEPPSEGDGDCRGEDEQSVPLRGGEMI